MHLKSISIQPIERRDRDMIKVKLARRVRKNAELLVKGNCYDHFVGEGLGILEDDE